MLPPDIACSSAVYEVNVERVVDECLFRNVDDVDIRHGGVLLLIQPMLPCVMRVKTATNCAPTPWFQLAQRSEARANLF
jgi:hypothetical protein